VPGPQSGFASPDEVRAVEAEGAGQEVHTEVEAGARRQQVLHLLVGLGPAQQRVDLDEDQLGHRQTRADRG
jgi:hypothetical protein